MVKLTIEIPDDLFEEVIKPRAEDFKTTPERYVAQNLIILFRPCVYDRSKWLVSGKDNSVTYEPYKTE